jgi:acetyl-CoA acetyltransferase
MTRMGKLMESTVKSLTREAVTAALADAGVTKGDLQGAFFSNATQGHMEGQLMIRGQIALRDMGIEGIPVINVENACASASTAFSLANQFLRAGDGDIVLAVGAEKMFSTDKKRTFSVFDSGWDISTIEENKAQLLALGDGIDVPKGTTSPKPYSVFMDVYAAFCRLHMKHFGTTQAQIAAVSAKNHNHSVKNEKSQYRDSYSVEDVLRAPRITYPLTLPMCAPISDGAAAAILVSEGGLKRLNLSRDRAIVIRASIIRTGSDRTADDFGNHITARAARDAYEIAGIAPADVSVAEVHDATAMGEIIQIENLGLVPLGEGGPASERGDTTIGGCVPVNPSGGLESKGHPIGATGLGQIYELVNQLRGECGERQVEGAKVAVAENGGGLIGLEEAVAAITVLAK